MNYSLDSSSIIYLGKTKLLEKIVSLGAKFYLSQGVYQEVVIKGSENKEAEVFLINKLIEEKIIIVKYCEAIEGFPLLSNADREVLALARKIKGIAIIDEVLARGIAISLGIAVHGSLYLILEMIKSRIITKKEAVNYIDRMITYGFYLTNEKYREVLNVIEKID